MLRAPRAMEHGCGACWSGSARARLAVSWGAAPRPRALQENLAGRRARVRMRGLPLRIYFMASAVAQD